jgi:RNA polymerase sigma-70 factor (ECF subfamily)
MTEMNHLLGHLRPQVYRQAVAALGDPDAAEDICQDVLLAVFRFLPAFRSDGKLTSWVYRITYNAIGSHLQREAREQSARTKWTEGRPSVSNATVPGRGIDLEALWRMVNGLVKELPSAQRDAVSWDFQGFRPTEIAAASGICPGTARSNLHRGRKKLRDRIQLEHPRFVAELLE